MIRVAAISLNTLREALRERVMYNLVAFAIVLIAGSLMISQLTLGEQTRIIVHVGSSATHVFGLLIAVFLGVGLVSKEMDRRTCYPVLARPVGRGHFLLGKYFGLMAVLGLNLAVMALATVLVLATYAGWGPVTGGFVVAFGLIYVQFAVAAAFAALFSAFTTATLATIFTLSFVCAGYVFGEVRGFWLTATQVEMKPAVRLLDVLLPNMGLLDLKEVLVYGDSVATGSILMRVGYGLGYAAVVLLIGVAIFSRRDLR